MKKIKTIERVVLGVIKPAQVSFLSRKRTAEEKSELMKICESCEKNKGGKCYAAKCCGGNLPIDTILNLNTTRCPLKKF